MPRCYKDLKAFYTEVKNDINARVRFLLIELIKGGTIKTNNLNAKHERLSQNILKRLHITQPTDMMRIFVRTIVHNEAEKVGSDVIVDDFIVDERPQSPPVEDIETVCTLVQPEPVDCDDFQVNVDASSNDILNKNESIPSDDTFIHNSQNMFDETLECSSTTEQPMQEHTATVKPESVVRADFQVDVGICNDAFCRSLINKIESIPPHSLIDEKRLQRQKVLGAIHACLDIHPERVVNCWFFDDFLPTIDSNYTTSLAMDIIFQFGSERLRLFSPNLKRSIVDHTKDLLRHSRLPDQVVTGVGCACQFNLQWASHIRACGGLDVIMMDGFGGIDNNVLRLLNQMTSLCLFRTGSSAPHVFLSAVVSDRGDRVPLRTVTNVSIKLDIEMHKVFDGSKYIFMMDEHQLYGASMHVIYGRISDRQWAEEDATGAFEARVIYAER